ncbi:MAG: hypothetical protein KGQ60_17800, partial [Planctomycetes bacterium]|nr:hypothetical protein [Planctomycetota bacterium]
YDFAFHFVPAFCTTIHWAQGETIREHYGVMDWPNVKQNKKAAYVAVTRGSSSYLHCLPYYNSDPWNVHSTADMTVNILRELYNAYCWSKSAQYDITMEHVVSVLTQQKYTCATCGVDLKMTQYMDQHPQKFRIRWQTGVRDLVVTCQQCSLASRALVSPSVK